MLNASKVIHLETSKSPILTIYLKFFFLNEQEMRLLTQKKSLKINKF